MGYARRFLARMERHVLREIREVCATLKNPRRDWSATELSYIADLPHIIARWHEDRGYADEFGAPRLLPYSSGGASVCDLFARVYPNKPPDPILQTLLRSGVVRRRGKLFEVTSRHVVFPPSAGAYLHGLIALLGILRTLRTNLSGDPKLLQQSAINSAVPVSELPSLYDSIRKRLLPPLIATDDDMMRREARGRPGSPRRRVVVSIHVSEDTPDSPRAANLFPKRGRIRASRGTP